MRFDGTHHLVSRLANTDSKCEIFFDFLLNNHHQQIFYATGRQAMVDIFKFPWGQIGRDHKNILTSRFLGPSSLDFVKQEERELFKLKNSIDQYGYNSIYCGMFSVIEGIEIVSDAGKAVCIILQGNHRVAVLHHLGVYKVKVLIKKRFRQNELSQWIYDTTFSISEATRCLETFVSDHDPWKLYWSKMHGKFKSIDS